jgi:hypothetical protein
MVRRKERHHPEIKAAVPACSIRMGRRRRESAIRVVYSTGEAGGSLLAVEAGIIPGHAWGGDPALRTEAARPCGWSRRESIVRQHGVGPSGSAARAIVQRAETLVWRRARGWDALFIGSAPPLPLLTRLGKSMNVGASCRRLILGGDGIPTQPARNSIVGELSPLPAASLRVSS